MQSAKPLPIVVLISGRGSNLQAIIDGVKNATLPAEIRAVISNQAQVQGLERARRAGIPTAALDHKAYPQRSAFDQALMEKIDSYGPELVVLAGFMRILGPEFVAHYRGHIFNIHPSLLPKFPGLNTHHRALEAGEREHGVSVHFVTDDLDGGPIIIQAKVPVLAGDDEHRLAQRVLEKEHIVYPMAIRWFAEERLRMHNNQAVLDGNPLISPYIL